MPRPLSFGEMVLQRVIQSGAKALGRAMESVLEDVGEQADGVSARTRHGRERLQQVGVGKPPPQRSRRSKRSRRDEEDE